MEILRRALQNRGLPETFALRTVQEAIRPQTTAVQLGEPIMQYGQCIDERETNPGEIPRLLDIVLYLCEKEHIEGGMIFQLLEDLTEMSTMKNCKDIFGFIESKQDILGKQELFSRGKLVMLRTCNQLLRRLSKANDVVFCGRILMFLAHFFPLSERSAVNIKGVFNTSNVTKYEKESPTEVPVDFNFYITFWSLQEYFCNPASLNFAPSKWQKFTSSLMVVLSTFEAQPLSAEGNVSNLEDEAANFSIKYLTSSNLMVLELKDSNFRRHILVQCLILFDYLKAPGKNDKDVPSESMKEEIKTWEERVKKTLEMIPPKGKEFLEKVEHILEREKNWVWWKRDGCPPFEKQPTERKTSQDISKKRIQSCVGMVRTEPKTSYISIIITKTGLGERRILAVDWLEGFKYFLNECVAHKRRPRWRLGNKELSQLWKWADQNPNALTDPQRICTPAVTEYWKPLVEDMDESAGIEPEYHHKNNRVYCWKGLRFSARQDLEGFSRFTDHGIEGVVPLELLPADIRSKYQAKPSDRSKRAKKEEIRGSHQADENQISTPASEIDAEGTKTDIETPVAQMETDAAALIGNVSQEHDEERKQITDMDAGQEAADQLEVDAVAVAEAGSAENMIDGETDADIDLETVG